MEKIPSYSQNESAYLDGKRYNVEKLYEFAANIPTENAPMEEFKKIVSKDNESWTGTDGKIIGPYNIFKDWIHAQNNPAWSKHVESIKNVDLNIPILVSHSGHVLDGQHRVVRALLDGMTEIKVKRLPQGLPEELEF